jgi:voltage-gated potassium channel
MPADHTEDRMVTVSPPERDKRASRSPRATPLAPHIPSPKRVHRWRHFAHRLFEDGVEGVWSIVFDALLVVLIVANVVATMLESVPEINAVWGHAFDVFEAVSVALFSIEYVARVWSAIEDPRYRIEGPFRGRVRYMIQPLSLIDLLAVAPSFVGLFFPMADLRALRVFRLLRILKIVRYSPALTTLADVLLAEWRALVGTLLLLICVMILSAEAMYLVEGSTNPRSFGTLPQAMYWAITTLTTVGYGDNVPLTAVGKVISGITMIMGLGLFALPVGIVATNFVNEIHRRDFVVTWSMLARVPLFRTFEADTIVSMMGCLRSTVLREHAVLALYGAPATEMFFIISGHAHAEYDDGTMVALGPGDHYGDQPIFRGEAFDATVTARSDMRVLTLSSNDLTMLIRRFPRLRRRFARVSSRQRRQRQEAV